MPRRQPTHACAAPDCRQPIATSRLMCRRHWQQLPEALRVAITTTGRLGRRAEYLTNVREAERLLSGRERLELACG